jgi:hypothetical protein
MSADGVLACDVSTSIYKIYLQNYRDRISINYQKRDYVSFLRSHKKDIFSLFRDRAKEIFHLFSAVVDTEIFPLLSDDRQKRDIF